MDRAAERQRWAEWLREFRKERNLSAETLATISGVSARQIYRVEAGDSGLTMDLLSRVAAALGGRFDLRFVANMPDRPRGGGNEAFLAAVERDAALSSRDNGGESSLERGLHVAQARLARTNAAPREDVEVPS